MRLKRHPRNRAFLDLCIKFAEQHPEKTPVQIEAMATIESLKNGGKQS